MYCSSADERNYPDAKHMDSEAFCCYYFEYVQTIKSGKSSPVLFHIDRPARFR